MTSYIYTQTCENEIWDCRIWKCKNASTFVHLHTITNILKVLYILLGYHPTNSVRFTKYFPKFCHTFSYQSISWSIKVCIKLDLQGYLQQCVCATWLRYKVLELIILSMITFVIWVLWWKQGCRIVYLNNLPFSLHLSLSPPPLTIPTIPLPYHHHSDHTITNITPLHYIHQPYHHHHHLYPVTPSLPSLYHYHLHFQASTITIRTPTITTHTT